MELDPGVCIGERQNPQGRVPRPVTLWGLPSQSFQALDKDTRAFTAESEETNGPLPVLPQALEVSLRSSGGGGKQALLANALFLCVW